MKSGIKILGIRADWKALFFCILTASIFWFFNAMNHDYTVDIYYPIEIKYDDSRVVPLTNLPEKIKINVTGYGWRLLRKYLGFKTSPLVYRPDQLPKKKFTSSDQLYPILSRQVTDITFNFIIKDTLHFNFDYLKEKKVKVVIDSGSIVLPSTYLITTSIILSPDSAIFKGPASMIAKIPDSLILKIQKTDIKQDFEQSIIIPEPAYQNVEMLNKEVKVRFGVGKFEKQSIEINFTTLNFPNNLPVKFEKNIILTYFVKEEDKNKVSQKDFFAYIDYKKLDKGDSTIIPILAKKPLFIKNYYFTPFAVKIRYEK